jgi:hypothetical protein
MVDLTKKPKPSGVCSVCQASSSRREALNHRCDRVVNGRRCAGTMASSVHALWDECESCRATGKVGTLACSACAAFGWKLYA